MNTPQTVSYYYNQGSGSSSPVIPVTPTTSNIFMTILWASGIPFDRTIDSDSKIDFLLINL